MEHLRQVVCMKWGTLYGPEYVNRLYAMVRQQLTGSLRFICLTDNRDGILPEVECYECPEVEIPLPYSRLGWRKVSLFAGSEQLFGLQGDWLYLDLDVVVSGALDDFFTFEPEKTYLVMQNWTQPGQQIGNTSVYRFRVGTHTYLLNNLLKNQHKILGEYNNSQTYISRNIKELNFWPDDWCALFKVQCLPPWPLRYWKAPVLPEHARVVAFPGVPNPHQAVSGEWPVKKSYKKLYKFIRPTPWIQKIWDLAEKKLPDE